MKHLQIKYSISKAKDTYGYNVITLVDEKGKKFKTCGGGYDMIGTVVGEWLFANYKDKLIEMLIPYPQGEQLTDNDNYGWFLAKSTNQYYIDGACGIDCMIKLARKIGLKINRLHSNSDRRGYTIGYIVED